MQLRTISYDGGDSRGFLHLELTLEPVAPREHLLNAVLAETTDPDYSLPRHLDAVALRHLQERTGTTGRITDNAQRFEVLLLPRTPLTERPRMYGGPFPYLPDGQLRELTTAQATLLPELAAALGKVTPRVPATHHRPRTPPRPGHTLTGQRAARLPAHLRHRNPRRTPRVPRLLDQRPGRAGPDAGHPRLPPAPTRSTQQPIPEAGARAGRAPAPEHPGRSRARGRIGSLTGPGRVKHENVIPHD